MRAREPDDVGEVVRDGVRVGYEVFDGPADAPTVLLLTSWAIVHMRQWKAQVPFLAREFRVITVEGRGNGASDRPRGPGAYSDREYVGDVVAALDASGTERAVAVGLSRGARRALQLAAEHPDRVAGVVAIGTALPSPCPSDFDEVRDSHEGWQKYNRHYWKADFRGWVEFFMSRVVPEPHSTKQWEDLVGWGLETDPETLIRTVTDVGHLTAADTEAFCRRVRCPVLVVHGDADAVAPYEGGVAVASWTGGSLVSIPGGGHAPTVRDPVRVNLLIRDFVRSLAGPRPGRVSWVPARARPRRVLMVSSPIGLGHARRDVAVAEALRERCPDTVVDWLAQHPVTAVLGPRDRLHPASGSLAAESAHIEAEAGEHDLHAFRAIRRMDEVLLANFHVFHDVVDAEHYDLVIADEGWEIDHFLHENPELKRSPYAWLTDVVGWLPMPDGGPAEAALTADHNAEMVEHIARYPRLRDLSVFVGEPHDLVTCPLGPGLPTVRDWTCEHFAFAGWVSTARPPRDRERLRAELGWEGDEPVCVVTAGGSGVGSALLRRVAAAYPYARDRVPGLRMVLVTGPRIDPASVPVPDGVEVRGHVPDLERELAACDVAVVQGGLTTTMELAEAGRPFLYFPLAHHFEQQIHVPYRLDRLGAGTRMDYATATPESIAAAIAEALATPVRSAPIAGDGAARAAALLASVLGTS
ncbi:alpha/beta hydrolase [Actinomycetospora chibensis]|uniref:Alpha/beta fold hydrolase n=1 Tax=Actinomycetospora chibensis TaxID=663606 RepID=A0ABV9RR57_9PSEU|nr:alpha/beta hydrolase [Actinomycetospora chibensis]MDD7927378.1 alpha/beta fold hydrolase [Actinomycetospora chibensis]